jgi:hypothetical protein
MEKEFLLIMIVELRSSVHTIKIGGGIKKNSCSSTTPSLGEL